MSKFGADSRYRKVTLGKDGFGHYFKVYGNDIGDYIEWDNVANEFTIKPTLKTDVIMLTPTGIEQPTEEGALYWDDKAKTLATILEGGTVKLQVGQEMFIRAVNNTGITIPNGSVVYIDGAQGSRPTVALVDADEYENSHKAIGVATEDIANNEFGFVTNFGIVRDLDTSTYNAGDLVYASQTAGEFTATEPSAGVSKIVIGTILKVANNDGWLLVHIKDDHHIFGKKDQGNYSYFEDDGTLVFKGDSTVWKDENAGGITLTLAASNQPTRVAIDGTNVITYSFGGGAGVDELHWATELQHDYKEGTDLIPHIHFYTTTTGLGNVKFNLDYYIHLGGTSSTSGTTQVVVPTNGNAWEQFRVNFDDVIDGTNLNITEQCHFRLYRDADDVQDTYTGGAAIGTVGFHYEIDTLGSRQVLVK